MTRKIKALGLAMAAFLALGAIHAAGASAQQGFITSDGPVTLTGTEAGEQTENRLTVAGSYIECPGSTYTGHKVEATPHELLESGATEATITPHYKEPCTATGGAATTIDMNGCDYVLKLGETTPAENSERTYGAAFDIVCPPEKEITTTTWYTEFAHNNEGTVRCVNHIPPQTDLTGAHATDVGNGHIKLAGTVKGITSEATKHSDPLEVCPAAGHNEEGEMHLNVTIAGHNEAGGPTPVSFEPVTGRGLITSPGPVTLTAEEVGAASENRWTFTDSFFSCPGSTYTGHKVEATPHEFLSSGEAEATITPSYKEPCTGSGGAPTTIDMNGCDYVLALGETTGTQPEVGGTYGVAFDIVCPPEKEVTLTTWYSAFNHNNAPNNPRCVTHMPPQTDLTGLHATDEGNGHIRLEGTVKGITVEKTDPNDPLGLCPGGHEANGEFDLNVTIDGHDELGETTEVALSHTA